MKKNKIAILLVTAVITSPATFAESPNFNYVDAGYLDGDIDGDDADGWTFDGSTLLGENFFLFVNTKLWVIQMMVLMWT